MSSANVNNTTAQSPKLGDTPNSTVTNPQWNGDPMEWESWPTGRPGPFVSESRMQDVMDALKRHNQSRNEHSRTKNHVLHIAEFSSFGRGEFDIYHISPE